MGVYIKGMEMPTCCAGCCLDSFCKHWDIVPYRHEDCPLVLVPPHGRLIDGDALKENWCVTELGNKVVEVVEIDGAPTIIPAEEGE